MEICKEDLYATLKLWVGVEITDNTRFFDGVGIDGLDAEQLMLQLQEKYNVDLTNYNSSEYHQDEIEIANFFLHIWRAIRGKAPKYSSFTALHLYNVVQSGKWFMPASDANEPIKNGKAG